MTTTSTTMTAALYLVDDGTAGPLCWFSSRREAQKLSAELRRVCGFDCPVEVKPLALLPQDEVERLATLDGADASVRRVAAREIAARARKGGSFRSLEQWTEVYGSAERAREAGVTGRLAEVCDGEYTWLRSTRRRSIAAVREEFLATADYAEIPALVIRIVPAV
jgi:hypothetical protein